MYRLSYAIPLLLALALCPNVAQAQRTWYFGNRAGVSFANPANPVGITGSQMNTQEGCTAGYDTDGSLLFYTDGSTLWDADHAVVATDLRGGGSSTQSGVVVRAPGSCNEFYVFSVQQLNGGTPGDLHYSRVQDDGTGDVSLVAGPIFIRTGVTERITAIPHANGTDFWILAHERGNNVFVAYLLTPDGLSATAIASAVGTAQIPNDLGGGSKNWIWAGVLKASPDHTRVACAMEQSFPRIFEVYDFDQGTGVLSNAQTIELPEFSIPQFFLGMYIGDANIPLPAYGLQFSPSSRYLYVSTRGRGGFPILQYDLEVADLAGSWQSLPGSETEDFRGDMQIGPDGRIYVANSNATLFTESNADFLSRIETPDLPANDPAFSFTQTAVALAAGTSSREGLPNFFAGQLSFDFELGAEETLEIPDFEVPGVLRGPKGTDYQYTWYFNDSPQATTADTLVANVAGTYKLTVETPCAQTATRSIVLRIAPSPAFAFGPDELLCPGERRQLVGAPNRDNFDYTWYRDGTAIAPDSTVTLTIDAPGTYVLSVRNDYIDVRDTIAFRTPPPVPNISLGADVDNLCRNEPLVLSAPAQEGFLYEWYRNDEKAGMEATYTVTLPGTYVVRVYTDCEQKRDTLIVSQQQASLPEPELGPDRRICRAEALVLQAPMADVITWFYNGQPVPGQQTLVATESGTYAVVLEDECAQLADTVILTAEPDMPALSLPPTYDLCALLGQALNGGLSGGDSYQYTWTDGGGMILSQDSLYTPRTPGTVSLTVTNSCGDTRQAELSVEAVGGPSPAQWGNVITPNGDGINEVFPPREYAGSLPIRLTVFDRWGRAVHTGNGPWQPDQRTPEGVYTVHVEYTNCNGNTQRAVRSLTLLR
ncbi:MAG: gliding motility-associated C-terminal domain-containing protein [Sphingobacteriia bacterium]|jgi:hypothetical protein